MMRNPFFLIVFLLLAAQRPLAAQAAPAAQDLVRLLDERTFQGLIIVQKPGELIQLLRLPEGDTLQFAMEQIEYIAKIMPLAPAVSPAQVANESRFQPRKRFVMLHGWVGGGDYSFGGLGLSLNNRLSERFEVGIGAHYLGQTSSIGAQQRQIVPLTADFRHVFSRSRDGRFSTHVALSTGYNFTLNRRYFDPAEGRDLSVSNGWYFNPGVAFRAHLTPSMGLMLDLGYQRSVGSVNVADTGQTLRRASWNNFALRGSLFF